MNRITLLFICSLSLNSFAQKDSIRKSKSLVPILSYDADLGLRIGGVFNYFKYKDSVTEKYDENFFIRSFVTSKKSVQFQSLYETDNLFPKAKAIIEITAINDKSYDFYGFNGQQSNLHTSFTNPNSEYFINKKYYSIHRRFYRFRFDYHRKLGNSNWNVLSGISFNKAKILQADTTENLYSIYQDLNILNENHALGGISNYLTLGLTYDNRNNPCYTSNGHWLESFFIFAPSLFESSTFSKFVFNYHTFQKLKETNWVIMSRISLQAKTSGQIPDYMKSTYFNSRLNQDALGGAFNLRGYQRNRVVADGFVLGNLEIRKNTFNFNYKKTQIAIDFSAFTDNAIILQEHLIPLNQIENSQFEFHFSKEFSNFYSSTGLGCYIILNKNSVINMNYGIALKGQCSNALYIGSSFLF
jgi:hypothetical protein